MKNFFLVCAALLLLSSGAIAAPVLWDSPDMELLTHLMGKTHVSVGPDGLKPFSTQEAIEILDQLPQENVDIAPLNRALRERLARESFQSGNFKLRLTPFVGYQYVKSPPVRLLEIQAVANPLLSMNEGLFTGDGNQMHFGVRLTGDWTEYFSFAVTPILRLSSHDDLFNDHASSYFREAMASLHVNKFVLEIGRGSMVWGNGRIGHLLFSGDAEPLNMIRIRTDGGVIPPGILDFFGPMKFEIFLSVLNKNRDFPHARLIGAYFAFLPHPRFEFALAQTVLFGGDGSTTNNPLVYFYEGVSNASNPADRNFLISFRWRVPKLEIEPYGEIMLEDCCRLPNLINPRDSLYLGGIFFPNVGAEGKMDLALEWVLTNYIAYRHSPFLSGYVYRNRTLGHPLGPDAMGIYAALRYFSSERLQAKGIFAYELRGRLGRALSDADITTVDPAFQRAEQRKRFEFELNWEPQPKWSVKPKVGIEHVSNRDYLKDNGHWAGLIGFEVGYQL